MGAKHALWAWRGLLPPLGLKEGWARVPGTQEGAVEPAEEFSCCPAVAKGSWGSNLPQLLPSHLSVLCQCPCLTPQQWPSPTGSWNVRAPLILRCQLSRGRGRVDLRGQQEIPAVRRGVGKVFNNLSSGGPRRTRHRPEWRQPQCGFLSSSGMR